MTAQNIARTSRITLVDAIRGFALLGLFLVHTIEHFDFFRFPENTSPLLTTLDPIVSKVIFFFFGGKAYAIFSLMFGLSFFIQTDRHPNFHGRFVWRLIVLLALGYLHGLVYCGDILTVFAVIGLLLPILDKLSNKVLLLVSGILILQIPMLIQLFYALQDPAYTLPPSEVGPLYQNGTQLYAEGSFADVVYYNSWWGQKGKWLYILEYGRASQMIALFAGGLILGRTRFFENIAQHHRLCLNVLAGSAVLFLPLYLLQLKLSYANPSTVDTILQLLLSSWANLAFMFVLLSTFILLYQWTGAQKFLAPLAYAGRTSLSSYLLQSFVGVFVFYNFGLGMYAYWGTTLSLVYGFVFFGLQLLLCRWWLSRFHYGPIEWLWRSLTFWSFDTPFRKKQ
jgi:uncharacterized protein